MDQSSCELLSVEFLQALEEIEARRPELLQDLLEVVPVVIRFVSTAVSQICHRQRFTSGDKVLDPPEP